MKNHKQIRILTDEEINHVKNYRLTPKAEKYVLSVWGATNPKPKIQEKTIKISLYVVFWVFALLLWFTLTFPHQAIFDKILFIGEKVLLVLTLIIIAVSSITFIFATILAKIHSDTLLLRGSLDRNRKEKKVNFMSIILALIITIGLFFHGSILLAILYIIQRVIAYSVSFIQNSRVTKKILSIS